MDKKSHKEAPKAFPIDHKEIYHEAIFKTKKVDRRDPRFEEASGKLDMKKFVDSYTFIEKLKNKEFEQIDKTL